MEANKGTRFYNPPKYLDFIIQKRTENSYRRRKSRQGSHVKILKRFAEIEEMAQNIRTWN